MARAACDRYQGRATDGVFLRFHPGFHSLRDQSEEIAVFVAFLPQFVDPSHPVLPQMILLSATFVVIAAGVDSCVAFGAGNIRPPFASERRARLQNRLTGSLLIGAGLWLAFTRRA